MSGKSKRVAFTFDERSYKTLEEMTDSGHFSSMADTVRESLEISLALQNQAKKGYTEVIMRNPDSGEERVVVIPRLQDLD
jgi:Arc/MetJ-type ribon-helix-helix transcriptional regulator